MERQDGRYGGRMEVLRCYSWNPGAPRGADHSAGDKACEIEAPSRAVFMQRPFSTWDKKQGLFKIPGEMAKWVNNCKDKQTLGH